MQTFTCYLLPEYTIHRHYETSVTMETRPDLFSCPPVDNGIAKAEMPAQDEALWQGGGHLRNISRQNRLRSRWG